MKVEAYKCPCCPCLSTSEHEITARWYSAVSNSTVDRFLGVHSLHWLTKVPLCAKCGREMMVAFHMMGLMDRAHAALEVSHATES